MDKYNHWIAKLFGWLNGNNTGFAVTFGQTSYYSCSESHVKERPWWIKHEDTHKEQYTRDGWFKFLTRYIWQGITKGYLQIDYEKEARAAAMPLGGPPV